jgi:hypothetical protein
MRRAAWLVVVASACGQPPAPPLVQNAALGGAIVARVGDDAVPVSLVASVSEAQGLSPRQAADGLIDDAVLAQGAGARERDGSREVGWSLRAARARLVVDRVRAEAAAQGPPADAEVEELTARHWETFDLPEQAVVVHAVVLHPKKRTAEKDAQVKATYDHLVRAVDGAPDAAAFEQRARAVPHEPNVKLVVERLPPFVSDGRIVASKARNDMAFATAAFTLRQPGAQARVESAFGWHVIQLIERLPAHVVSLEERRAAFKEEALDLRAQKAYTALLARLRGAAPISISPAADGLMQDLSIVVR